QMRPAEGNVDELLQRRAVSRHHALDQLAGGLLLGVDDGEGQLFLRGEVEVERSLGDPGAGEDVGHAGRQESGVGEGFGGGPDNRLTRTYRSFLLCHDDPGLCAGSNGTKTTQTVSPGSRPR